MTSAHADWSENRDYVSPALAFRAPAGGIVWLIGRVVLGGLFFISGAQKLMGIDQFAASLVKNGVPDQFAHMLAWLGAGVETIGGLLIVLGLATSWASLFLIAFTILSALDAQRHALSDTDAHGGERALAADLAEWMRGGHREARTGHAERMAERDRTAVRIDVLGIVGKSELAHA